MEEGEITMTTEMTDLIIEALDDYKRWFDGNEPEDKEKVAQIERIKNDFIAQYCRTF